MAAFNSPPLKEAVQEFLQHSTPVDKLFSQGWPQPGGGFCYPIQSEVVRMLGSNCNDTNKLIVTLLTGLLQHNRNIERSVLALSKDVRTLWEALPKKEDSPLTPLNAKIDALAEAFKTQPAPPPPAPIIIQTPPPATVPKAPKSYAAAAKAKPLTPPPAQKTAGPKENQRAPAKAQALPKAQRRFFATRSSPAPLPQASALPIQLPSILGNLLARNGQVAPATSLTVSVNPRGTVTVLAPPSIPTSQYAPFFGSMTQALNAWAGTPENPYTTFRPAPTNVDVAVHGIPLASIPNNEALNAVFPEAVSLATGIKPASCRFLNKDPASRATKNSSSIVISVTPEEATKIGNSLRLFSKPRRCTILAPATAHTICHRCCLLGHPTASCKREPRCGLCTKAHLTSTHRCPVPTCPGALKPLENCCEVSPAKCPGCLGKHSALNPSCPCRVQHAPASAPAPPINHTPMETE